MWESLASPVHFAHYDEDMGVDWAPMRRVVRGLATREYAPLLYGYTSLDMFCLTFSPTYEERDDSPSIALTFDPNRQVFEVRYQGSGDQDRVRYCCEESELDRLVDALVLRMQLTGETMRRRAGVS